MLELFANASKLETITVSSDEYMKNEKLYCKKCGKVKKERKYMTFLDKYLWLSPSDESILCDCVKQERKATALKERKEKFLSFNDNVEFRKLLGSKYINQRFNSLPPSNNDSYKAVKNACLQYCIKSDSVLTKGQGLYFYSSNAGTGKTTLLACMRNALIDKEVNVLFLNETDFIRTAQDGYIYEGCSLSYLYTVDVLLFDDIGATDLTVKNGYTDWLQKELYTLFDKRYKNEKCTVFTSNYHPQELTTKRGLDFKTTDRIVGLSSYVTAIQGNSFRGI